MEKAYTYILKSEVDNKFYIGSTRNLEERFKRHNSGKVRSTKSRKPFILLYSEEFSDYPSACKRELFLKIGVGRKWLKDKFKSE